jgi:hypothetical protein
MVQNYAQYKREAQKTWGALTSKAKHKQEVLGRIYDALNVSVCIKKLTVVINEELCILVICICRIVPVILPTT